MYFRYVELVVSADDGLLGMLQLYDKTTKTYLAEIIRCEDLTLRPIAKDDVNRAREAITTVLENRARWVLGAFVGIGGFKR